MEVSSKFIASCTFVFLVNFIYTRLYVFIPVILGIRNMETWGPVEYFMSTFLMFLLLLNVIWIVAITGKFIKYLISGKIEDIHKPKMSFNKNK